MALLDVFTPEVLRLEQLRAFWHFASVFSLILLSDELGKLFVQGFLDWSTTQLLEIDVFRFKYLENLLFKGPYPIECSLELLIRFALISWSSFVKRTLCTSFDAILHFNVLAFEREWFAHGRRLCGSSRTSA